MLCFRWTIPVLCLLIGTTPVFAQTTAGHTGTSGTTAAMQGVAQGAGASGSSSNLVQSLQDGGLLALLSNVDNAKTLGLDLDQWLMVQFLGDEYARMVEFWAMLDPEGQNAETWQALATLRFFLDMQIYFILTPEQQQKVDQLFQQAAGTTSTGSATSGLTSPSKPTSATPK